MKVKFKIIFLSYSCLYYIEWSNKSNNVKDFFSFMNNLRPNEPPVRCKWFFRNYPFQPF